MANTAEKKNIFKRIGGFFARLVKGIGRKFKEMFYELKKVTWPNKETVLKNTGTVLLCSLAIGVCIWIFDFVMVTAVQMILSLFA